MDITTHRGSKEIGGTCIELAHGGTRIILDVGIPVTKPGGGKFSDDELASPTFEKDILPPVKGLYAGDTPSVDAVLLSHSHADHYGLMDFIHPDIPVFLSKDAKVILETGNVFWAERMRQEKMLKHCRTFDYWRKFTVGPFSITPYLVDHSAYGACAYLVEAGGKKVFYTGDFRAHGRKKVTFDKMLKDPNLNGVDVLIIEGTNLGGGGLGGLASEADVQREMTNALKNQNEVSFAVCSGSNIDRIVSLFNATCVAGKELVLDLYQYHLLSKLKERYSLSKLPPFDDDHIRIRYIKTHADKIVDTLGVELLYKYKHKKIDDDEILREREKLVLRLNVWGMGFLAGRMNRERPLEDALFIYSMWHGYLKDQPSFYAFRDKYNLQMKEIHTSGHAYKEDLIKLVEAIRPKQLVPVHTLHADEYKKELNHKNINVTTDKVVSL